MLIFKEDTRLDAAFPFQLNEYVLKRTDNTKDSYHYHDYCEITYVKKGRGEYLVGGRDYEVTPGDLIIFNNVEPHGWQVLDKQMEVLVITFAPQLVSNPGNVFFDDYLKPFITRGSSFQNRIDGNDPNAGVIREIMLEIQTEYEKADIGYKNMIQADILRILTYLIRHYQTQDDVRLEQKRQIKRLEPALFYIHSHFTETIRLEDVAALTYMSPNYFCAYFKKAIGKTFMEYVTLLRLKRVKQIHQMTGGSLAEIALESGFSNVSNFYRMYKKYMGELPPRSRHGQNQGEYNEDKENEAEHRA